VLRQATEWLSTIPPNAGETVPAIDAITWYGAVGCDACHHTGYKGRVGIYEVFTMSAAIEQEILSQQVSEYRMKELLHAIGMVTMGQDGVLKAAEGLTTLEEVFRVAKE
jgi:general secretion pathway protein E